MGMFENAINSKKQGDIGMCYAIAYFSKMGYTVNIPITDSQDYDLIIDREGKLLKVQVKTTKFKIRDGVY
jgi:HJR/Mrr/RecB family endonuclease